MPAYGTNSNFQLLINKKNEGQKSQGTVGRRNINGGLNSICEVLGKCSLAEVFRHSAMPPKNIQRSALLRRKLANNSDLEKIKIEFAVRGRFSIESILLLQITKRRSYCK